MCAGPHGLARVGRRDTGLLLASFFCGGIVKGITGMGLPLTSIALMSVVLDLQVAIPLLVIPIIATNILQAFQGEHFKELMRKFWFMYLAKALVVFPGGFGTLDELFEALTLIQTKKVEKKLPVVLYGKSFWRDVLNLEALVKHGTISPEDLDLFFETDSVDEAYDFIVNELKKHSLERPGAFL